MASEKNRLDQIYTRAGDRGETSLASGDRLSKADDKIKTLGEVDELNCQLGVLLAVLDSQHLLYPELSKIQHSLFDLGAQLAMDTGEFIAIEQWHTSQLEAALDTLNLQLPPLKEFILPGGDLAAAHCHLARAVCRRLERQLVGLLADNPQHKHAFEYINRLSDFLFVCARVLARASVHGEVLWKKTNRCSE